MKAFTSNPTELGKVIDFELDGETYEFLPPKTSTQVIAMMQVKGNDTASDLQRVGAMFDWLANGLNKEHQPRKGRKAQVGHREYVEGCKACLLQARLEDPQDDLEIEQVMEVITWLMGESTGRPTT